MFFYTASGTDNENKRTTQYVTLCLEEKHTAHQLGSLEERAPYVHAISTGNYASKKKQQHSKSPEAIFSSSCTIEQDDNR